MKSGGLFSPEQRGVGTKSLATQIDVSCKENINTTIGFAEPGINQYVPFGAIFAFMPREEEYHKVLHTGIGTEVDNGVQGVNFREEPDRLVAIITTNENLERLRKLASETGFDPAKVVTREGFLDMCKEKYRGNTR